MRILPVSRQFGDIAARARLLPGVGEEMAIRLRTSFLPWVRSNATAPKWYLFTGKFESVFPNERLVM
jgi:hypothetical protein